MCRRDTLLQLVAYCVPTLTVAQSVVSRLDCFTLKNSETKMALYLPGSNRQLIV